VTHHANSIAGALYKNSSKLRQERVNYSVCSGLNDDRTRKVFRSRRSISSDGASRSRIAADRLFSANFQSYVVP